MIRVHRRGKLKFRARAAHGCDRASALVPPNGGAQVPAVDDALPASRERSATYRPELAAVPQCWRRAG